MAAFIVFINNFQLSLNQLRLAFTYILLDLIPKQPLKKKKEKENSKLNLTQIPGRRSAVQYEFLIIVDAGIIVSV